MTAKLKEPAGERQLKEALREIQIMAGLNRETERSDSGLVLGITSPEFGDGKTTVAIGLAATLAHDFQADVTLVDSDFHTTSVGKEFGLIGKDGLGELMLGKTKIEDVGHRVNRFITIIPAGKTEADPARAARSHTLVSLVDSMRRSNRFVVIDLPAVLHSMNAAVLSQRCDGVVVVTRARKTSRLQLERTLQLLGDSNVVGVVLNRQRSRVPRPIQRLLNLRG